jgi:hypothetical protein
MYKAKIIFLCASIIAPLILLYMGNPITQNLEYHNFADQRSFLDMNNFFDVISNIAFLVFGILGIIKAQKFKTYKYSWMVFLVGVVLVAPGSAFYHWNPNNFTLIWDRLPMTIGFMGIFTAIVCEVFKFKQEVLILIVLNILGMYSVLHWQIFDDLRLYYWIQLTPLLTIILISFMFKNESILPFYLAGAFGFYLLAKITEKNDDAIFLATNQIISGHTIKHLLAAVAVYLLYKMKVKTESLVVTKDS